MEHVVEIFFLFHSKAIHLREIPDGNVLTVQGKGANLEIKEPESIQGIFFLLLLLLLLLFFSFFFTIWTVGCGENSRVSEEIYTNNVDRPKV